MNRSRIFWLILAGVVFLTSGLRIVRHLTQPSDIWWTPKGMSPSLNEVADRVEVYVRESPLPEQIRSGRIQLLGGVGSTPVTEFDVRFRFNNWDRIRAREIPVLLTSAALFGASCVMLVLSVLGWMPARPASSTT